MSKFKLALRSPQKTTGSAPKKPRTIKSKKPTVIDDLDSEEEGPVRVYASWDGRPIEALLEWLETGENYNSWKFSSTVSPDGQKVTSQKNKKIISVEIVDFMKAKGVPGFTDKMVKNKMAYLEKLWKDANVWLDQTGEGVDVQEPLTERGDKIKNATINSESTKA